ncbi:unnamed protein product [Schistosoma mattheei]|uniref:Uncharacterized protein n=1 Tax=Schistosoma mattheei TaxID=31246 RepID=A0A183P3U2_9TREM|nr:unnamed protein product [Schistosoma mattheei]
MGSFNIVQFSLLANVDTTPPPDTVPLLLLVVIVFPSLAVFILTDDNDEPGRGCLFLR